MALEFKAGIDHAAFVKDVEKGMRAANRSLSKRTNTLKLKLDDKKNLPDYYCKLGLNLVEPETLGSDIYPDDLYLLRHIDTGTWLWKEDGYKVKIL